MKNSYLAVVIFAMTLLGYLGGWTHRDAREPALSAGAEMHDFRLTIPRECIEGKHGISHTGGLRGEESPEGDLIYSPAYRDITGKITGVEYEDE